MLQRVHSKSSTPDQCSQRRMRIRELPKGRLARNSDHQNCVPECYWSSVTEKTELSREYRPPHRPRALRHPLAILRPHLHPQFPASSRHQTGEVLRIQIRNELAETVLRESEKAVSWLRAQLQIRKLPVAATVYRESPLHLYFARHSDINKGINYANEQLQKVSC